MPFGMNGYQHPSGGISTDGHESLFAAGIRIDHCPREWIFQGQRGISEINPVLAEVGSCLARIPLIVLWAKYMYIYALTSRHGVASEVGSSVVGIPVTRRSPHSPRRAVFPLPSFLGCTRWRAKLKHQANTRRRLTSAMRGRATFMRSRT